MADSAFSTPAQAGALSSMQAELVSLVDRFATATGPQGTAIPRLRLFRADAPTPCSPSIYEPGLALIAQGSKVTMLGAETYVYDPLNYLVVSVTLPMVSQIVEASPERPYLSLRIDVDPGEIGSLILDIDAHTAAAGVDRGLYSARVTESLLDAVLRLLRLLDAPRDIPVLAPLALREIAYRVLVGELGHRLREVASADSRSQRVARAVEVLKQQYPQPLSIEALAQALHMSTSSLHHHFKAVTAMSPLQYQKQLRLHEARRLMLMEGLEATTAAHRVGYESPSQFSREYKRLFGAPPKAEIGRFRPGAVRMD